MKLKYIYHSGFSLELENYTIIFDYYKGEVGKIDKNKKLLVFSSHSHNDHYNAKIFEIFKDYDVRYILSDDILVEKKEYLAKIDFVSANKEYLIEGIRIKTLRSTDQGVAFLLELEGKTVYHSGDLNWWTWKGFESQEEYEAMTKAYKKEIEKIKGLEIDLAMVVLDYRQKERYDWGIKYLLENTRIKNLVPMHTWGRYKTIEKFRVENKKLLKNIRLIKADEIKKDGVII